MIKRYSNSKLVEDFINFPKMDFGVLQDNRQGTKYNPRYPEA
jgi:hypothetical protein